MQLEVNIWTLVKSLLNKYNCVIVPGLGGFIAHQESAVIDPISLVIKPPFKHITFNAQLTLNDGLLVTQLADYLKIDYVDAIKIVDNEVLNFKQFLKNNSQFQIAELGNFTINSLGTLLFVPEKTANFLLHSFGLETIKLNHSSNVKTTKIISNGTVLNTENNSGNKLDSSVLVTSFSNRVAVNKKERKQRNGLTFTALGTFLILILGINAYIFLQEGNLTPIRNKFDDLNLGLKIKSIFETYTNNTKTNEIKVNNNFSNSELLSIYNPENIQKNAKFDTKITPIISSYKEVELKEEKALEVAIVIEETPNIIAATPIENIVETPINTVQSNTFYIIAGAFKNENKALEFVNELSTDGFVNSEVILNPNAKSKHLKYYVTYTKFSDLNQTITELNSINENENPDAWIFESK
jgi:hypothetical protein